IWARVLEVDEEKIGIDADLFRSGAHSLKATVALSKIHKELKVKIPLSDVFRTPTIRELAQKVKTTTQQGSQTIEAVEKKEYYPLSSAQKRVYFLQQMESSNTGYNIPAQLEIEGEPDKEKFEQTFYELVKRHESLRTAFPVIGEDAVQEIHETVEFHMEYYDCENAASRENTGNTGSRGGRDDGTAGITRNFIRPFDLSQAPLLRVGLLRTGAAGYILQLDMHHIISDGTSMGIFIEEFMRIYRGESLPPLNIQYKDYTQWQLREKKHHSLEQQEAYWHKEFDGEIPVLELPTDSHRRPGIRSFEGNAVTFELEGKTTTALKKYAEETGVTLFMLLLTIYNILLAKLSMGEDIIVGAPTAGRKHADLQHIIGMFVNTLALRNYPGGKKNFKQFLEEVKERTLKAFENQDYQFEDLVEKVNTSWDMSRNPFFDTMLVLQNTGGARLEIPGLTLKTRELENRTSKFDLTLQGEETGDRLLFTME
ncbi:MAG: non-ribosomal peptide synthetase, partial [bacterium]|nr:non-ribosomal peptide synthetase [bacterium]